MKNKIIVYVLLFLFLGSGWAWADGKTSAKPGSCEDRLDISKLPLYTSFIKTDLSDLKDYFTCKAAVKEDIQVCNIFSDDPTQKASCQDAYHQYYETFGKLYKNGRVPQESLGICLKSFASKGACEQLGEVLLSGNPDDCEKIEGITPKNMALCKDMASSDPEGHKAHFMMVLRHRDPAACDKVQDPLAAAICKGLLIKNADGCQFNAGADRFKKLYCQHLST